MSGILRAVVVAFSVLESLKLIPSIVGLECAAVDICEVVGSATVGTIWSDLMVGADELLATVVFVGLSLVVARPREAISVILALLVTGSGDVTFIVGGGNAIVGGGDAIVDGGDVIVDGGTLIEAVVTVTVLLQIAFPANVPSP